MPKIKALPKWKCPGMRPFPEGDALPVVQNLLNYLHQFFPVTDVFNETINPMLWPHLAKRNAQFARPGEEVKIALWIDSGYIRLYNKTFSESGKAIDETIDFVMSKSIFLVPKCFFNNKKCDFYVEVPKNTVVIPFSRAFFDELKSVAPEASDLANSVLSANNDGQLQKSAFLRLDAEQRYELLVEIFGERINQYFTQKDIASFLGITSVYLSALKKIRNSKKS